LAELLKSVIWQLGSTGGHDVHELKRAGMRELAKNEDVIRRIAKYPVNPSLK